MEVSGVRSSCEASATNWRSWASVSDRWSKADSIWLSMMLRAAPSWPTSESSGAEGIRRAMSPEAMAAAVSAIVPSGRRPRPTVQRATTDTATTTTSEAANSIRSNDIKVARVGSRGMAVTRVPWGTATAAAR